MQYGIHTLAMAAIFFSATCSGATLPGIGDPKLLPESPTSGDNLKLSLNDRTCGTLFPYKGNPYRVGMSQNNLTVTFGEQVAGIAPGCPSALRQEIDLGRLPAGNYTITVIEGSPGLNPGNLVDKAPFTIADARATKGAPYVSLDYSGHWWDPNDSGWGLFIWQDARSSVDSLLVAWFTYKADGKPMWYVFQPQWRTDGPNAFGSLTTDAGMVQVSRMPGATSPPPTPRDSLDVVGTARLSFRILDSAKSDEGELTYTFTGGALQTRTIKRFRP